MTKTTLTVIVLASLLIILGVVVYFKTKKRDSRVHDFYNNIHEHEDQINDAKN